MRVRDEPKTSIHYTNAMYHETAPVPEWPDRPMTIPHEERHERPSRLYEAMAGCSKLQTGKKIADLLLMQCVRQTGRRQVTLCCSMPSQKYRSFSLAMVTFAGSIPAERSWPSLIHVQLRKPMGFILESGTLWREQSV